MQSTMGSTTAQTHRTSLPEPMASSMYATQTYKRRWVPNSLDLVPWKMRVWYIAHPELLALAAVRHVLACSSVYSVVKQRRAVKLFFNLLRFLAQQTMKSVFVMLSLTLLALTTGVVHSASLVSEGNVKWVEWKSLHKKSYADAYEENFRHAIWRYNLKVRLMITLHRSRSVLIVRCSIGDHLYRNQVRHL